MPSSTAPTCTVEATVSRAAAMLEPWGIPTPGISFGTDDYYEIGQASLVLAGCVPDTVLAHELGHYVMDLANDWDWAAHRADALAVFCPGGPTPDGQCATGWIKGRESHPGIEHAAHCVGWALVGAGAYTKCPDASLQAAAAARLAAA